MLEGCATDPLFCTLNSGNRHFFAVVKFMNNPQGNLSLINELCAAQICQKVGISLPNSGICHIDTRTILDEELKEKIPGFSAKYFGTAFYSEYICRSIPFNASLLPRVDVQQLANMIIFDHLVFNRDRHEGNVLIEIGNGFTFYLLDHSHIFKNACIWDRYTFSQGISSLDYLDESIYESNDLIYRQIMLYAKPTRAHFKNACEIFQRELTQGVLHSIIEQVPLEWSEGREKDLDALEAYLNYRIAHLREMTELIIRKGGI